MADLVVREYGIGTESVIALHGGPAAAGDVAPLALELGKRWHVFEPFQRGSGIRPLTVATHVQDLDDLIRERCGGLNPILSGHSWGAMLALAYAASHPATPAALVLIGCGTFSLAARTEFEARLEARLTPTDRANIAHVNETERDAGRRRAGIGRLMTRVDMLRLQRDSIYPPAFAAIGVPVLMLHGEADPHPGRLIRDDLRRYIPLANRRCTRRKVCRLRPTRGAHP